MTSSLKNDVNPLDWRVPIVNKDGTPTPEFQRKWQAQANVNGQIPGAITTPEQVSALLDLIGDTPGAVLYRGASGEWVILAPGTDGYILRYEATGTHPEWVAFPSTSDLLDTLGTTRGAILYRGASAWAELAPGTAGDVLTSQGAGADPHYAPGGGGGGGYSPGSPPTVVQAAWNDNGASVTFAVAPTPGNKLVAWTTNPNTDSLVSGWTNRVYNSSGTDWGQMTDKTCGASESTTQQAVNTGSTTCGVVMLELAPGGSAVTPVFVFGGSQGEQTGQPNNTPITFPCVKDCIAISGCGAVSNVPTKVLNAGHLVHQGTSGNRPMALGWATLADIPAAGIIVQFGSNTSTKSGIGLWT